MKKEPDIIDLKWISKNNSYISTFKFFNTDGNNKGEYFSLTKTSETYVPYHEKIVEIYSTLEHEDIHHALAVLEEADKLTIVQEHLIIKFILLAGDDIY